MIKLMMSQSKFSKWRMNYWNEFSSDDDLDTNAIIMKANHQNTANDLDNEEAVLHEFDFLSGDAATTGK